MFARMGLPANQQKCIGDKDSTGDDHALAAMAAWTAACYREIGGPALYRGRDAVCSHQRFQSGFGRRARLRRDVDQRDAPAGPQLRQTSPGLQTGVITSLQSCVLAAPGERTMPVTYCGLDAPAKQVLNRVRRVQPQVGFVGRACAAHPFAARASDSEMLVVDVRVTVVGADFCSSRATGARSIRQNGAVAS